MRVRFAQSLKRWARVTRLALHVARGLAISTFLFPLQSAARRRREIEHWSLQLLTILNVRLFLHGMPPPYTIRPLMLVANHVSWLDICMINAIVAVRFVAKAEIRRWPLLGWLCARAGTLFIDRGRRRDTTRINQMVARRLVAGDVFAVFPEGTTTDGSTLLKFHASLLEPALEARAAIQPVALWFDRSDGTLCTEAAYDEEKSAWQTLMGITSQHEILAHVCFLPPIFPGDRHRRELAYEAREAIRRMLFPQQRYVRPELFIAE
ncbi:MAG TPA: lysophospholipid acyltransferase family protein [Burkholderiales bacterium]|nr:lysophospholipid acyltransferase family protein [Burkholderiales bacterium]